MAKTDTLQGSLDLLVLKILSRRARLHGYAIMTAIEEIWAKCFVWRKGRSIRHSIVWKKPAPSAPRG